MNNKSSFLVGLFCICLMANAVVPDTLQVTQLRCEYLKNPLGIDELVPRLSWVLESPARNQRQTAYQVLVAGSLEKLNQDRGELWDSGKVESDQSVHIEYIGKPLDSGMQCFWKVRVWDKDGKPSEWSEAAMWSMGLLNPRDWQASWIGLDGRDGKNSWLSGKTIEESPWAWVVGSHDRRLPARYLRREFILQKPVKRATIHVSGLGFFDMFINGEKTGNHVMDPALSDYEKVVYYVSLDVTPQLNPGANALGVILGNGRFYPPRLTEPVPTKAFGYPRLLFQMGIEYEDGGKASIVSDKNWKITDNGPIVANNEYDGEEYDARLEVGGWSEAGFDDSEWEMAQLVKAPGGQLQAQMIEPMRVTEVVRPVGVTNPEPGKYVVDMGQVFYGTMRLKVSGPAGARVQMQSAYSLKPDGTLKTEDNRSALSTDVYILKGDGHEVWSPRFRGQGYRRVEVTGFPGVPTVDNFEGLVIHTDVESVGKFTCSNDLINQIYTNIRWTQRTFKRSAPLDPDRDERQVWNGDPAKDSESDAFNFLVAPFYSKYMDDVRRSQRFDGTIPDVAMYWNWGSEIVWPSVFTIIPDWMMDFYGDERVAAENYEAMKRWVLEMHRRHMPTHFIIGASTYGDWCDTSTIAKDGVPRGNTPPDLIAMAYHYNNCRIMARTARMLGKTGDEKVFIDLAEKTRTAFNQRYFNSRTNKYKSGTQTSYVLPLAFDMVPKDRRQVVAENLVEDVMVKHNGHLTVGTIGMQWLMQVLTDTGHPEVAYTIVTQTDQPGWGYMIERGATTIWERWDTDTKDPGMNSEALLILSGNLEAWFYQTLAGINYDRDRPGFKHIILRPQPVGDLTWVKAEHRSQYGLIRSSWKKKDGCFEWEVTVPANTTATVFVPARDVESVTESGEPVTRSKDVKFLRMEDGAAVLEVGSGAYAFSALLF